MATAVTAYGVGIAATSTPAASDGTTSGIVRAENRASRRTTAII
jgi:hypothetical protein